MWAATRATKILGLKYPIIQAPMAGSTTPELVAAVSSVGALGSLGGGYMPPNELKKAITTIRTHMNALFAVNLFVPQKYHVTSDQIDHMQQILLNVAPELHYVPSPAAPPYLPDFKEQLDIIIDENVPILSFTFGIPEDDVLTRLKAKNIILIGTATNLAEALLLEQKGIDLIVAQGSEAGGHRGTFIGKAEHSLIPIATLIPQLLHNIKIPVIAAGGIMNADKINKLLTLGADGVQMGTAFLSSPESGAHPTYKACLLKNSHDNTVLTRTFSGKLARSIRNKFIANMEIHTKELLDYPIQHALTKPLRQIAAKQNNADFMFLLAGQSYPLSTGLPAKEFLERVIQEMERL